MSNYLDKQTFSVKKFSLEIHPYLAAPDNRFAPGSAIQYGADFKVSFKRQGTFKNNVGLLQLIFPRTAIFPATVVGQWNVDKHQLGNSPITMGQCLYSDPDTVIGAHSSFYSGQKACSLAASECWLIDTPREIKGGFNAKGEFSGVTSTKLANYVVELSGKNGTVFNAGIIWGYSYTQNAKNPAKFDVALEEPRESLLSETNEHLNAIATFLNQTKNTIKSFVV